MIQANRYVTRTPSPKTAVAAAVGNKTWNAYPLLSDLLRETYFVHIKAAKIDII
jgi:hypothetical protein